MDFLGSVTSIARNTSNGFSNYPGNAKVDKINGKTVSQGFEPTSGTISIRLDVNGNYDNFQSSPDPNFVEAWGLSYSCLDDLMIAVGGGTTGDINFGVINTTTGAVTSNNITGIIGTTNQDIICTTFDSSGTCYGIMNDIIGILPFTNTIYKVNSTLNGNIWAANSNYSVFNEAANMPFWCNAFEQGNWFNCLDANNHYIYYYDGFNVSAFSQAIVA